MAGYRVVKVLRNGSRVSVVLPSWHPLYRVYQRNGKNQTVKTSLLFSKLRAAYEFIQRHYEDYPEEWSKLHPGEFVEVWSATHKKQKSQYTVYNWRAFTYKGNWKQMYRNWMNFTRICRFVKSLGVNDLENEIGKVYFFGFKGNKVAHTFLAEDVTLDKKLAKYNHKDGFVYYDN